MDERDRQGAEGDVCERIDAGSAQVDELDVELAALFSDAFDDVRASDELRTSTLAAIFAQLDDEQSVEQPVGQSTGQDEPVLTLVDGGAVPKVRARARRPRTWWLRVAAVAVVATLATGGVAYATPTSRVVVSGSDASVELGVNVFGRAISVSSDDAGLQAVLEEAGIRGSAYEEALDHVLDACDERAQARDEAATGEEAPISVEVSGSFWGDGDSIAEGVGRVMEEHAQRRAEEAEPGEATAPDAPEQVSPDTPSDLAGEPGEAPNGAPDTMADESAHGDGSPERDAPAGEALGAPQG